MNTESNHKLIPASDDEADNINSTDATNAKANHKIPLGKLIQSMLAGAIGVQSSKKYEEDFNSGSIVPYIIGGIIFTGIFIGSILTLVSFLLAK